MTQVLRIIIIAVALAGSGAWVASAESSSDTRVVPSQYSPAVSSRIKELSVCDGTDEGTVADELCKVGMTGPGGGIVFFIDHFDQFPSFCPVSNCNYLQASPAEVSEAVEWCSDMTSDLGLTGWDKSAVGAGRRNSTVADRTCTSGAIQVAADYTLKRKKIQYSDWWLPSIGELMLMYTNLRQAGVGEFMEDLYWSSSEYSGKFVWNQYFDYGNKNVSIKSFRYWVRPIRAF